MTVSADNPYAPPKALVSDVDDDLEGGFQDVNAFSWQGRIGRMRYLAYGLVVYVVFALAGGVLGAVGGSAGGVLAALAFIPYLWMVALLTIQRSHDMDWSGWMSLLALIPFVGLIWI